MRERIICAKYYKVPRRAEKPVSIGGNNTRVREAPRGIPLSARRRAYTYVSASPEAVAGTYTHTYRHACARARELANHGWA